MNKRIITKWNGLVASLLVSEGKALQVDLEPEQKNPALGNIYIGKVNNLVKNINAAFVDMGNGEMGYLSLTDPYIRYAGHRPFQGKLCQGDEILIQVEQEGVKTKAPVLTGNLSITGRYFVLTSGKKQLGFSSKIMDQKWKQRMKGFLEQEANPDFGIIVRTNAYQTPPPPVKGGTSRTN